MKRVRFLTLGSALGLGLLLLLIRLMQTSQAGVAAKPLDTHSLSYDTLVEVTYADPDTLDPAWNYETAGNHVIQQIYDPLITLNREKADEFVPMLATDWTISGDGSTYIFQIREGVRFHNGNHLTPGDVAYSFQRALLQGGGSSPQWLFAEPLLGAGIYDICGLVNENVCDDREALQALQVVSPTLVRNACISVTNAIVADQVSGTVTFHLAQPWNPFLSTLVGSWSSILDKEWAIANGGWDGSCDTWQDYYDPDPAQNPAYEVPFAAIANGTGPFMLDHWTPGDEIVLTRNRNYWRQTPMWPDGPSGPASFEQVIVKPVPTATIRVDMLLSGDADLASTSSADWDQLDEHVLLSYQADGRVASLQSSTGTLRAYLGGLTASASDAFFTYDIITGGLRNYVGSGALDGNGIPLNFFNDIHVRKAFNYSFDWDQYIAQVFNGEAIQRRGPIIKGILGYTDTQATYFYSPTLALQEFSQAWGGQVISAGFVFTVAYNQGNATRQVVCEILKAGVEALDPKFHINVVELPWPDFLDDTRYSQIPIFVFGWMQDIPHPHNWVQPWLIGTYASRQRLPDSQRTVYETKIYDCLGRVGNEAQTCYEDIQNSTYLSATDIFLAQAKTRRYVRAEVQGYYVNMAMEPYFYALAKGPLPSLVSADVAISSTLSFAHTTGSTSTLYVPPGAVNDATTIVYTPQDPRTVAAPPPDLAFAGQAFDLDAYQQGSVRVPGFMFNKPVTLTFKYAGADVFGVFDEDTLALYRWTGGTTGFWEPIGAQPGETYTLDVDNNLLTANLLGFSRFGFMGTGVQQRLFLPLVLKNS